MKSTSLFRLLSLLFSLVVIAVFAIVVFFYLRTPLLISLDSEVAQAGDVVVIRGKYLGVRDPRNSLFVGGQRITSSYILQWERDQISFRVPEGIPSGDVRVELPQGDSNALLFTNEDSIPLVVSSRPQFSMDISLRSNSDDSLWDITFTDTSLPDLSAMEFFLGGQRIPPQHIWVRNDGVSLYVPFIQLLELSGMANVERVTEEFTADELEHLFAGLLETSSSQSHSAPSERSTPGYLEFVRSGKRVTTLFDNRSATVITDEQSVPPLFSWTISLPEINPEGPLRPEEEYLLWLPELEGNFDWRIESTLRGLVSLEPEQNAWLPGGRFLRFFPRNARKAVESGDVIIDVYGEVPPAKDWSELLATLDDNYDQSQAFIDLYAAYLEPEESSLLDEEIRERLTRGLRGIRGALPLARTLYEFIQDLDLDEADSIRVMTDELRRLGIAARERQGYRVESGEFYESTWAEMFLPRFGWVALRKESFSDKLVFGQDEYSYIALPIDMPFPQLLDSNGNVLSVQLQVGRESDED